MPRTIKDLTQQIEDTENKASTQTVLAQEERLQAEQFRTQDNLPQMESHLKAGTNYDQRVVIFQNESKTLQRELSQLQTRLNTLQEKKLLIVQTYDQELARVNAEIEQITGEPAA